MFLTKADSCPFLYEVEYDNYFHYKSSITWHSASTFSFRVDHEERINQFEPVLARGVVRDITDEELLLSAGIDTCDTVVVAMGENLESSVLKVMYCKSLGVPSYC